MVMKHEIIKEIENILKKLGVKNPKVSFDAPVHMKMGDYTTSVALAYAKELGKKPLDLAEEITRGLSQGDLSKQIEIKAVAPGFVNFFFDNKYFAKNIMEILKEKDPFVHDKELEGQKFFVEHTQPNPFKEFHIGHLMNNTIGESVCRIIKSAGADVKVATYHGDIGLHIAKAVWAIKKGMAQKDAYAYGHKAYEEDDNAKQEIIEINKEVYDKSNPEINKIYDVERKNSLDYFESVYKLLDSHFDYHFYESQSGIVGKELVMQNIGKIFENGDGGAVIFRGENYEPKTHTRVFLNSDVLPTYEAKELGLSKIKKDLWHFAKSITVTANEQDAFFNVVEVAIGEVFPDLKGKLKHLSHGMMKLPSGKMSSRTGTIIPAEDLINQVKQKVLEKMNTREDFTKTVFDTQLGSKASKLDEIATTVAIGAIKYSILRQAIGGDIIFDFDKSISFEGDSGPYLQYSTVRANSVLKRAQFSIPNIHLEALLPSEWKTINLERLLERFGGVLSRAVAEYAPHHIATYLIELSGEFNSFYASEKIIGAEDGNSPYRLAIVKAFAEVMTTGLDLLGIKVPERM